jgi:excisionase family DNA binding protein
MADTRFITAADAARELNVDRRTVYRLAAPQLPGVKLGRNWLFSSDDVARLKARRAEGKRAGGASNGDTTQDQIPVPEFGH